MRKRGNRRTGRLGLLCAVALAACGAFASHAWAETKQVEFSFNDGRINIGRFKGEQLVDPAQRERIATLVGLIETTTGDFSAPPSGLFVPDKVVENVGTPNGESDVVLHFFALGPIGGSLSPGAGTLTTHQLNVGVQVSVYRASDEPEATPMLMARCEVSPIPLPLSSEGALVDDSDPANPVSYDGAPFAPAGAAVATWERLPPSRPIDGPFAPVACPMVDQMASGPGGVWLAGLADLTEAPAAPFAGSPDRKKSGAAKRCKRAKKKAGKRKRRCRRGARASI